MNRLIVNSFSLLAFSSFVISSRVPVVADDGNSNATRLRPIHIVDYEAAIGLHRRASESFSDLDLQTQSHLIYGSSGGMCAFPS